MALVLGIGALIVFALVLILVSGKAIKPITDTYHKQQEFITNAGHELKTPLAVISANTEWKKCLVIIRNGIKAQKSKLIN